MINERTLTKRELDKREKYVKDLKPAKRGFVKRYGKDAEAVMYATATKRAKKAVEEMKKDEINNMIKDALMKEKGAEFTDKYNDSEKLTSGQKKLPDALQKAIIDKVKEALSEKKEINETDPLVGVSIVQLILGGLLLTIPTAAAALGLERMGQRDTKQKLDKFARYLQQKHPNIYNDIKTGRIKDDEDVRTIVNILQGEFNSERDDSVNEEFGKVDIPKDLINFIETGSYSDEQKQDLINRLMSDVGKKSYISKTGSKDIKEDLDVGHQDNEPHMLKGDLYRIAKYASELYKMVNEYDKMEGEVDFPHWWQSKIIKARDYLVSAKHYLDGEEKIAAIDAILNKVGDDMADKVEPEVELTEEEGSEEVKVGNYQTEHFDICPGAVAVYKDIEVEDMDLAERAAKMNDALFAMEKAALADGASETDVFAAELVADQIMEMAKMMGLEKEHSYVQGHVNKIKDTLKGEKASLDELINQALTKK